MAGNSFYNLASQFSASAARLQANINSVIEKYDRHFEDDDLISLASLSVSKHSSKGTLQKIKKSQRFGSSHLQSTKRKDDLLKLKLGVKGNKVDLNVSRAIERECAVALADLDDIATNEPSDAETLSSFDEDEFEKSWDYEEDAPTTNSDFDKNTSDDERLSDDNIIQSLEDSYSEEDGSYSIESSHNSSGSHFDNATLKECNDKVLKNSTVVLELSSESEDEGGGEFFPDVMIENRQITSSPLNCTYVMDSPSPKSKYQQKSEEKRREVDAGTIREQDMIDSSFVSISSPRPKARDRVQNAGNRRQPVVSKLPSPLHNAKSKIPNFTTDLRKSSSKQPCSVARQCASVTGKGKGVLGESVITYDGVFKSPQGIRPRRIAPVPLGSISKSRPDDCLLKHSSNSSGISSCSSLAFGENDINSKVENIQPIVPKFHHGFPLKNDVRRPIAQSNIQNFPPNFDNSVKTKANRVDQWVDMVNMNSTMAKEPLHYPSCPPKILKEYYQQKPQSHSCSLQKQSTPHSPSSNKCKDIGIQTTLNCTVRCSKRNSPPRKMMKDVSTILSNSFLDAHSPGKCPTSNEISQKATKSIEATTDVENLMFPEEYVYKFSPLNPNRIDSDDSANMHQNYCLRQSVKHFRPRRNKKRALEVIPNDLSSSRHSKIRKIDTSEESFPYNARPWEHSFANSDSFFLGDNHDTFEVQTPKFCKASSESCKQKCRIHKSYCPGKETSQSLQSCVSHKHVSRGKHIRASTPSRLVDEDRCERNSCDFVNSSSLSETGMENDCCEHKASLISPKFDAFLDPSSSLNTSNNKFVFLKAKANIEHNGLDSSFNSSFSKAHSKVPRSFLSPVKADSHKLLYPTRKKHTMNDLVSQSLSSKGKHGLDTYGHNRVIKTNEVNKMAPLSNTSDKESRDFTPGYSLCDDEIQTELDVDETDSGSFVDAHTPKARIFQSSPMKTVLCKESCLKRPVTISVPQVNYSKSDNKSPLNSTFFSHKEGSFHKETLFDRPSSNSSLRKKHSVLNSPRKRQGMDGSDCVSGVWGKKYNQEQYQQTSDVDQNCTEEYSTSPKFASEIEVPNAPFTCSKRNTLDITVSTIYDSDDEEIGDECNSDSSRDGVFQPRTKTCKSQYKSVDKHFSSNSSLQNCAQQKDKLSKNVKSHYKQSAHGIHSVHAQEEQRESRKGLKHFVREYREENCENDFERRCRASTPVRQNRVMPTLPLNCSMSTIVGRQDESLSDSGEEDWDTKLIEDVDVL